LGERWLDQPEPKEPLENRSLVKYKLIIDEFGGWSLFQSLLKALQAVAQRHSTDIATIASAFVLARPGVSAVIVGARNRTHLPSNLAISAITLTAEDQQEIDAVLTRSNTVPGEVYELERETTGRHGSIMKYNLNSNDKTVAAR
jgi:diketogulonate reductase-like aldo/keto reductase